MDSILQNKNIYAKIIDDNDGNWMFRGTQRDTTQWESERWTNLDPWPLVWVSIIYTLTSQNQANNLESVI